jgi:hypothetical protein
MPIPLLVGGLCVTVLLFLRARAVVGPAISAERPGSVLRKSVLIGLQGLVLAAVLVADDLRPADVVPPIALAMLLVVCTPGFDDATSGETGVRRGFYARRYEELEEWRLMGEHLRFRLFGEWTSAPLPASEHPRIRAKLESLCPERESQFKD